MLSANDYHITTYMYVCINVYYSVSEAGKSIRLKTKAYVCNADCIENPRHLLTDGAGIRFHCSFKDRLNLNRLSPQ